jgi:Alginate export
MSQTAASCRALSPLLHPKMERPCRRSRNPLVICMERCRCRQLAHEGVDAFDAGYELPDVPMSPRLGLKADAISGDGNPFDRQLGTFNPLFPRLPYFSEANLATPANLLDLQPNLRLSLTERLRASVSWNGLWKHAKADAYYAPPLTPVDGTAFSKSRDIGWQASTQIEWQATRQLQLAATYVSFEPGAVVRQAHGCAGSFFGAWVQWSF